MLITNPKSLLDDEMEEAQGVHLTMVVPRLTFTVLFPVFLVGLTPSAFPPHPFSAHFAPFVLHLHPHPCSPQALDAQLLTNG